MAIQCTANSRRQYFLIIKCTIQTDTMKERAISTHFRSSLYLIQMKDDIIQEGENAECAFNRHMEENDALKTHSEKLYRMLEARDIVQRLSRLRKKQ